MFSLPRRPPRCGVCLSTELRESRNRGLDNLGALVGLQPWRCRSCQRRCWHFNPAAAVPLLLAIVVLALGVLCWRLAFND
jgi:hypothetical protein